MDSRQLSESEIAFLKSANRVTVGKLSQFTDTGIKVFYVPRIRGRFVCHDASNYKFDTSEKARQVGKEILAHWKGQMENGNK